MAGIINRSYYDAAEKGRQDRDAAIQRTAHNALSHQAVAQGARVNALMDDPQATPEAYARVGRSDVANSLTNISNNSQGMEQEGHKRLFLAAQYALQSPDPKAFIAQNFPELAKANPTFDTDTPEQVAQSLQQLLGKHGANAGIAPAPRPVQYQTIDGPRGSRIQVNPETGEQKQIVGPDNTQPGVGGGPPSGYRWGAGGRLEPIPGGPADPLTPNTKDDSRIFAKADKLRDEFNTQSKDFVSVGDAYNVVKATGADNSAAGDLSMIFAFMKMLDPTSVVREQEFANAQNAAGVPDRIRNQYNKIISGERLNETQRKDFLNQANNLYKTRKTRNDQLKNRYTEIAKRNRVNPDDVVGDMAIVEQETGGPNASGAQPGQPVQVKSAAEAAALPSGTEFITPDGRRKVRP